MLVGAVLPIGCASVHGNGSDVCREFIEYINGLDYADTAVLPVGDGVSISLIDKKQIHTHEES